MTRAQLWAVVGLSLAAFVLQLVFFLNVNASWTWAKSAGTSVTAVAVATVLFDKWLWRVRWLFGWFHSRPDLNGTWDVTFNSNYRDGEGERTIRTGVMTVSQSFFGLDAYVETDDSNGVVVSREFIKLGHDRERLSITYRNEPKAQRRDQLQMHYGSFLVAFEGPRHRPERMQGSYWTDRQTAGEIVATRRI